jgi:hypothetical protein
VDICPDFCCVVCLDGSGVGFDTKGAGSVVIKGPNMAKPVQTYVIPDSREGWVEALRLLLHSYFAGTNPMVTKCVCANCQARMTECVWNCIVLGV